MLNKANFSHQKTKNGLQECINTAYSRWWVIGLLSSIVSCLGLAGNMVSLFILTRKSMHSVFNYLLACLCAADTLFLISNLLILPVHFVLSNNFFDFLFPLFESLCHFSYSASIFTIVTITIERWQVQSKEEQFWWKYSKHGVFRQSASLTGTRYGREKKC